MNYNFQVDKANFRNSVSFAKGITSVSGPEGCCIEHDKHGRRVYVIRRVRVWGRRRSRNHRKRTCR